MRRSASEKMALIRIVESSDLSPRELACRFTDEKRYFVSESSGYQEPDAAGARAVADGLHLLPYRRLGLG